MDTVTMIIVGVIAVAAMVAFGILMRRVDAKLHNTPQEDQAKKDQNKEKKK